MRYHFIVSIIFLFVSPSVSADEKLAHDCEKAAFDFGNGQGKDKIPSACYTHALNAAASQAIKESSDGTFKVFAHQNIVFISKKSDDGMKVSVLAGGSTGLREIVAVAIDESNQEVAVLQSTGEILFFSSVITGNVSARRVIRQKELIGGRDLLIDSKNDEAIVANPKSESLLYYPRLKNDEGRKAFRSLSLKKRVEFPGHKPTKLIFSEEKNIIIQDQEGKNLHHSQEIILSPASAENTVRLTDQE